jgi:opacity protein-like surface antigen
MYKTKLLLFVIFYFANISYTQAQNKINIYFEGGVSFPSHPKIFSDYWSTGYIIGTGIGYTLSPTWSISGSIHYNRFSLDDEGFLRSYGFGGLGIQTSGGSAKIVTILSNLKYTLLAETKSLAPYIIGGIGYMGIATSDIEFYMAGTDVVRGRSESAFSFFLGTGLILPATKETRYFIQVSYGIGLTKNDNTHIVPIKAGIIFSL